MYVIDVLGVHVPLNNSIYSILNGCLSGPEITYVRSAKSKFFYTQKILTSDTLFLNSSFGTMMLIWFFSCFSKYRTHIVHHNTAFRASDRLSKKILKSLFFRFTNTIGIFLSREAKCFHIKKFGVSAIYCPHPLLEDEVRCYKHEIALVVGSVNKPDSDLYQSLSNISVLLISNNKRLRKYARKFILFRRIQNQRRFVRGAKYLICDQDMTKNGVSGWVYDVLAAGGTIFYGEIQDKQTLMTFFPESVLPIEYLFSNTPKVGIRQEERRGYQEFCTKKWCKLLEKPGII
ncbi:MAG: hypothetical protein JKX99_11595 [Robiginitomaculum sp.]|nr:hypothetical protein [Robiginitomaculum sp.]